MTSLDFLSNEQCNSLPEDSRSHEGDTRRSSSQSVRLSSHVRFVIASLVSGVLLLWGCDSSVQPFVSSDEYHYSVYGILNPSQDTQWVRVEPLEEPTSAGVPEELDVTVRLENTDREQTWVLQDSLMEVFRGEPQHNFWTTAPIDTSTLYRLTVRNSEGETTIASTTTPAGPPSIEVQGAIRLPCTTPRAANQFEVTVEEAKELAALRMRYYQSVFGPTEIFEFDHYDDAKQTEDGYTGQINYFRDLQSARQQPDQQCIADSAKVIAAAGGPDWPEWARYSDATISQVARPDSFTNVTGGHGTIAGVYTDTVRVRVETGAQQ